MINVDRRRKSKCPVISENDQRLKKKQAYSTSSLCAAYFGLNIGCGSRLHQSLLPDSRDFIWLKLPIPGALGFSHEIDVDPAVGETLGRLTEGKGISIIGVSCLFLPEICVGSVSFFLSAQVDGSETLLMVRIEDLVHDNP